MDTMSLTATPSVVVQTGFIALSILLAIWWIGIASVASTTTGPASLRGKINYKYLLLAGILVLAWLSATTFVGYQSWAHNFDSFPPPALRVFLVMVALTLAIAYSPAGKKLALSTPLWLLVGFQVFRIPVEFLIHMAYTENLTIIEMTYLGRNFDILTGVSALILAVAIYFKNASARIIWLWNTMGMLLLLNAVATGIFSMPHPMQLIETDIPNIWITFFPFISLPAVLVCSAMMGHLLVYRHLRHQGK